MGIRGQLNFFNDLRLCEAAWGMVMLHEVTKEVVTIMIQFQRPTLP